MCYTSIAKPKILTKEYPHTASITQDMRFRLSVIRHAEKYDVTKAAVKYKTNRQYIYRWKRRYDGSISIPTSTL